MHFLKFIFFYKFVANKNWDMQFTENFLNTDKIEIEGQYVSLFDNEGRELKLFVGEEIKTVSWVDNKLMVTLASDSIRLYKDTINFGDF